MNLNTNINIGEIIYIIISIARSLFKRIKDKLIEKFVDKIISSPNKFIKEKRSEGEIYCKVRENKIKMVEDSSFSRDFAEELYFHASEFIERLRKEMQTSSLEKIDEKSPTYII